MPKISSKKIFLIIFLIITLSIAWRFLNLLSFRDSNIVLQKGLTVKLRPRESLQQNFVANRDGLTKVEVLLRSPGIKYENGDRMEMKLADADCKETLRTGYLDDSFLNTENLYEFRFDRIPDSQEKEFCLTATFANKKENAKSIQFFTMGDKEGQSLSIRPVYKNAHIWQDFSELNQRISQYKPWFLKHYYLWIITIAFIVFSIASVVILITL
ncbi:MAG: hypothetical protein Q8L11_00455 [Candidatus Moranbacteria bacterium]|nr:hypothetical protein [Candidatus Moranbacteria bacterium]